MGRQWTEQQKNAIYATDGSVLVSAAAGSGKTAVLVERVLNLITREENPIEVDRLLIVTFTRAAAAEMRERLSYELDRLLEDDPYNQMLLQQKQLLYNASISTIDSFCGDIVREYFHSLDISRDFRIADEGELNLLRQQALDLSFEEFYLNGGNDFIKLVDAFSSKNGDIKLRDTVLKINEFLSTQPFPNKWLDDMLDKYSPQPIINTIWGKIIAEYAKSAVQHMISLTDNSINQLKTEEKLYSANIERFDEDLAFLNSLENRLDNGSWDDIAIHLGGFKAGRLSTPRGYKENPVKIAVAANRDEVKSTIKSLQGYFEWSEAEAFAEIGELRELVTTLFELEKCYIEKLSELMAKKNILSFADIELLAVKLLATPDENGYNRTAQAIEISERFDAVMVDEFQDVNDVQDLIFKCVSNNENNLFVVGDVKQSIYGFRQAKPQIFIDRKSSYKRFNAENPNYPATIILDKNFRSRQEVCDTVNFLFSRIMSEKSAQMNYTDDEKLNVGAVYPKSDSCDTEIVLIEKKGFEDLAHTEAEARYIALKIRKMLSENFMVKDGDIQRKATYGDFAVILRSPKSTAMTYVNTLISYGIPAFSESKENSFESQEVKVMLNLLRTINNPTLDIPLLSVMCSPIYGFTPDELAELRADSRFTSLYTAVLGYSEKNEKAAGFLRELDYLRKYSYTCGIDDLIGKVYDVTSFSAITSAVKGGASPSANLNLLREYARNYETNGYKTLSDFINFIDKLIENGTSLPASPDGGELNGVRVLSIHASKGLEYPVCFIADTGKKFNEMDLREDILVDSNAGLGIKKKDGICRYNTLPRLAVGLEIATNNLAEEMRVLYVALTRAREKLIIVSSQSDVEKYLSGISSKIVSSDIIEPYAVTNCKSISDWIMLCAMVHPSFNAIRQKFNPFLENIPSDECATQWQLDIIECEEQLFGNSDIYTENIDENDVDLSVLNDFDYSELLKRNINFKYKNSEIMNLPQKVSASEIAHKDNSYFERILEKPSFLSNKTISAAERGTAHHKFLQYCNFRNARKDINEEINRLLSMGVLDETQAKLIDFDRILKLINLPLFDRIINSEKVLREEQFFVKLKPSELYDEYSNEISAEIMVQGAVDIAFVENGSLIIVDYKTDRVKDIERLKKLYEKQLQIYRLAMEQQTELRVSQCIICSLYLDEYICI